MKAIEVKISPPSAKIWGKVSCGSSGRVLNFGVVEATTGLVTVVARIIKPSVLYPSVTKLTYKITIRVRKFGYLPYEETFDLDESVEVIKRVVRLSKDPYIDPYIDAGKKKEDKPKKKWNMFRNGKWL